MGIEGVTTNGVVSSPAWGDRCEEPKSEKAPVRNGIAPETLGSQASMSKDDRDAIVRFLRTRPPGQAAQYARAVPDRGTGRESPRECIERNAASGRKAGGVVGAATGTGVGVGVGIAVAPSVGPLGKGAGAAVGGVVGGVVGWLLRAPFEAVGGDAGTLYGKLTCDEEPDLEPKEPTPPRPGSVTTLKSLGDELKKSPPLDVPVSPPPPQKLYSGSPNQPPETSEAPQSTAGVLVDAKGIPIGSVSVSKPSAPMSSAPGQSLQSKAPIVVPAREPAVSSSVYDDPDASRLRASKPVPSSK